VRRVLHDAATGSALSPAPKSAPLPRETVGKAEDTASSMQVLQAYHKGDGSMCLSSFAHCRGGIEANSMCLYGNTVSNMGWSNVIRDEVMVCELLVSDRGCNNGLTTNRVQAGVIVIDPAQGEVLLEVNVMWKVVHLHGYAGKTILPEVGMMLSSDLETFPRAISFGDADIHKTLSLKLGGLEPGNHVIVHVQLCVDRAEMS
jgi:hypothetical protein